MAHTKNQLQNLNKDGSVKRRPQKHTPQVDASGAHRQVPADPTEFNARDHEHARHVANSGRSRGVDPRAGGKPKTAAGVAVPTHGQMFRVANGKFQSVSPTEVANAPDADPANPVGKEPRGKELKPVAVAFGMKSQSVHGNVNADTLQRLGQAVLSEALKSGGR